MGLLAYPFLLEPHFNLTQQAWFWLYVYLGFFVLALFCGLALRGLAARAKDQTLAREAFASNIDSTTEKLSLLRRFRWVALSFAPSSLLLGVTTYITTDLASVPLLWVLPLSLYLVSFIVGFQRDSWGSHPFVVRRQSFLLLGAAITFFANATEPAIILLPLHLLSFFATALVCHAELAKDRPQTQHLTEYYLWISFGGVLGGFFNGFLAPLIFNTVAEYPLAMIGAALVRPPLDQNFRKPATYWLDFIWPATLFIIILGLVLWVEKGDFFSAKIAHVLIFGVSGVIGLSFAPRPVRYALGIAAIMLATSQYHGAFGQVLFTKRSFFGVYRAMQDNERNYHYIFHGTTLHGAQSLDPKRRLVPISYYYSTGPVGQVFRALSENGFDKPVAIVGLGAGALACYGKPGQIFTFYEIDPLVERIARDPDLFTYLKDCSPRISVRIGDARLTLPSAPGHYYGMFILDAFSGDSIPIHLLTREAVELYLSKLVPEGVLLFNISNRYMGSNAAVAYASSGFDLDGLVVLSPGHFPEGGMGKRLRSSYERAKSMVAANRGADSDSFEDINQGKQRSLKMTAGIYVSYFDPNGLGAITKNIKKFSKPVPVLLVIGTVDPFYPEAKAMFDSSPANAASRYVPLNTDHFDMPNVVAAEFLKWLDSFAQ